MKQARSILAILLFGCAVMAVVDGVIQPGYAIKSLVKLTLFLGLPLWWSRQAKVSLRPLFTRPRQGLRAALLLGAGVFAASFSPGASSISPVSPPPSLPAPECAGKISSGSPFTSPL